MAFTQSDLDTLDAAIASGTTEVRYADGSGAKYRDLDDMLRTRAMIAASLAAAPAAGRNPNVALVSFVGGGQ
jgi:hypothetical protein